MTLPGDPVPAVDPLPATRRVARPGGWADDSFLADRVTRCGRSGAGGKDLTVLESCVGVASQRGRAPDWGERGANPAPLWRMC